MFKTNLKLVAVSTLLLLTSCMQGLQNFEYADGSSSVADATVNLPPIDKFFKMTKTGDLGSYINGAQLWVEVTDSSCGLTTKDMAQPAKPYAQNLQFPLSLKAGCSYKITLYLGKLDPSDSNKILETYSWNNSPGTISKEQIDQHIANLGSTSVASALNLPIELAISQAGQDAGIAFVESTNVPVVPTTGVNPTGNLLSGSTPLPTSSVVTPPADNPVVTPPPVNPTPAPTGSVNLKGAEALKVVNAESGSEMNLGDAFGGKQYMFIVASAKWCGPCKQFYALINDGIGQGYDKNCSFAVTGLSGGGREYRDASDMKNTMKSNDLEAKHGFIVSRSTQEKIFTSLGSSITGYPSWMLVKSDGTVVKDGSGGFDFGGKEMMDVCKGGS